MEQQAMQILIWAAAWQNQQNDMCTKWRLRSAWAPLLFAYGINMFSHDAAHIKPVYAKTARLSDKTGKFSFCPAENCSLSDKCPTTLYNSKILIMDMFCDF